MNIPRLLKLRRSGLVRRFHTIPYAPTQTIAEHCYGMLTLLLELHEAPSMQLVKAVMHHDAHEADLGDIPSPAKTGLFGEAFREAEESINREMGIVGQSCLGWDDRQWLRALDSLEGYLFCHDVLSYCGLNVEIQQCMRNYAKHFSSRVATTPEPIINFLKEHFDLKVD